MAGLLLPPFTARPSAALPVAPRHWFPDATRRVRSHLAPPVGCKCPSKRALRSRGGVERGLDLSLLSIAFGAARRAVAPHSPGGLEPTNCLRIRPRRRCDDCRCASALDVGGNSELRASWPSRGYLLATAAFLTPAEGSGFCPSRWGGQPCLPSPPH